MCIRIPGSNMGRRRPVQSQAQENTGSVRVRMAVANCFPKIMIGWRLTRRLTRRLPIVLWKNQFGKEIRIPIGISVYVERTSLRQRRIYLKAKALAIGYAVSADIPKATIQ